MKQKRQIGILVILLGAAAIVWAWNFHDKRVVTADASSNLQDVPPIIQVPNPHIRMEEIDRARSAEYKGSGRDPFSPAAAPVAPAAKGQAPKENKFLNYDQPQPQPPAPPPPPPVIPPNVKFYGYGSGGTNGPSRRAFFYDGDEVHILGEGDVLLKRFRIIRIGNDHIEFAEISTGRVGTAPLEAEAPPGPQP